MSKSDFKTVVILGMHRSGTSMTGAILNALGVNMGKKLLKKDPSNPLGHFEDIEFLKLNQKILKAAGGNWANPPNVGSILRQKDKFEKEIKILTNKQDMKVWGWKDPRTCLTIDLYLPYIKNPHFIVCNRDANEIGESLNKRNNFEIQKGIRLAKIYDQRIADFFRRNKKLNKIDLFYREAINDSEEYVQKIIRFLELEVSTEQCKRVQTLILSRNEIKKLSAQV